MSERIHRMMKKGHQRFWHTLIHHQGGVYDFESVPIDEKTLTDLIMADKIIHLEYNGQAVIPKFQFDDDGNFLEGISRLLEYKPEWTMYQVCLFTIRTNDPSVSNERPLDSIQCGDIDRVFELVDMYNVQRP